MKFAECPVGNGAPSGLCITVFEQESGQDCMTLLALNDSYVYQYDEKRFTLFAWATIC